MARRGGGGASVLWEFSRGGAVCAEQGQSPGRGQGPGGVLWVAAELLQDALGVTATLDS